MLVVLLLALLALCKAAVIEPGLTDGQKNEITAYVNKYRAMHSAPAISFDSAIMNDVSQPW